MMVNKTPDILRQRGIALIVVLLLLVFVMTILATIFYRHQVHIQKSARSFVGDQADLIFLSVESWVIDLLHKDRQRNRIDHAGETWSRHIESMEIEGGKLSGCLLDLQGKFNLNNMIWYTNERWDYEINNDTGEQNATRRRILKNYLQLLGQQASDDRLAALVDWVDTNSWLTSAGSAEDNEYLLADPPYRAANYPITDITELVMVQGYQQDDVRRMQPWFTALPADTVININSAPVPLLMSLSSLITENMAEALVLARPFSSVNDFYQWVAGKAGQDITQLQSAIPETLIGVSSSYFQLQAFIEIGGLRMSYKSIIFREGSRSPKVLSRTIAHVPQGVGEESINPDCVNKGRGQKGV